MACLRVSLVYLSDVSRLFQDDIYISRISHIAFPTIGTCNFHLLLQVWFRDGEGSWHNDVFSWCDYRRVCFVSNVWNVVRNELAQLAFSGRFNE